MLLVHFGGVGSKSRRGLGNFAVKNLAEVNLENMQAEAHAFRIAAGLGGATRLLQAASPALEHLLQEPAVDTPWTNVWFALDRTADAAQTFAQGMKHQLEKKALGLPRRSRGGASGYFQKGPHIDTRNERHASPVLYHLHRRDDGAYSVKLIAFPSAELPRDPSLAASRTFLVRALGDIRTNLHMRVLSHAADGKTVAAEPIAAAPKKAHPASNDWVAAELLVAKTRNGGWIAKHLPSGLSGPLTNSNVVPAEAHAGQSVTLVVASCNGKQISFRWPIPADLEKRDSVRKPPKGPPRRR